MAEISVEGLTFTYPKRTSPALDDVSLLVPSGAFCLLTGPSGCGKTTLLRHLKALLRPKGQRLGQVRIGGVLLDEMSLEAQAARIGFVMQSPDAQIVCDKVWHELAFGLECLGTKRSVMRGRVAEMASYFGLGPLMEKDVHDLSGGERQLLNLASVMATSPDVLILDEPTAQLDPMAATDLFATLRRLNRDLSTTVVMVEQRLGEIYAEADLVAVMEGARLVCAGTPAEVAQTLHEEKSAFALALPAAPRIFFDVGGAPAAKAGAGVPLTVKEGRAWLKGLVAEGSSHVDEGEQIPAGEAACEGEQVPVGGAACEGDAACAGEESAPATLPSKSAPATPPSKSAPAVELKDVWFRYDRETPDVLRGLNLSIPQGKVTVLLGANGVGKTTVLKVACGLRRPYRGSVRIHGMRLDKRHAGGGFPGVVMLPQNPLDLFVKETVCADLLEMLEGPSLDEAEAQRAVAEMAEELGIEEVLDAHPYDLSGGQAQRAAIAKLLLARPKTLLLDEPTKGLDALAKRHLTSLLHTLTEAGHTVVLASHDMEFCAQVADSLALIFNGEVTASAPPREFFGANTFYTTPASRMSRRTPFAGVTVEEVAGRLRERLS